MDKYSSDLSSGGDRDLAAAVAALNDFQLETVEGAGQLQAAGASGAAGQSCVSCAIASCDGCGGCGGCLGCGGCGAGCLS